MLFMFLIFGGLLPVLYAVVRYWRRSHVKVNCWFCGLNNIIPKKCYDGWICKHCEQYNGFKSDGDYNRDISAQWDTSLNSRVTFCTSPQPKRVPTNGLCQECNRNQELKIAQLASFQPINPENFDHEIENFSYHLERAYRLCPPCEAVLEDTLSRKKTHVLDMHLQLTGKKIQSGNYVTSKHILWQSFLRTTAALTSSIALILAMSTLVTISSDHIVFSLSDLFNKQTLSEHKTSPSVPPFSDLLSPSTVCPKQESSPPEPPKILSDFLDEKVVTYLALVGHYSIHLCSVGLILQGLSSLHFGQILSLLLWIVLAGTELFQQMEVQDTAFIQISQIVKVATAVLILSSSWSVIGSSRSKSASPLKRERAPACTSKQKQWKTDSVRQAAPTPNLIKNQLRTQNPSTLLKQNSFGSTAQDGSTWEAANYLTLPGRPTSLSSSHPPLSIISADNPAVSPPADVQSTIVQEDTRSDASVDSAFSNPDSITLDAADSFSSSFYGTSKKRESQDDVHSLIESLSIGSRQSVKKPSELRRKPYGSETKRSSLLSPSRLSNIMNESMSSGIWRNTKSYTAFDAKSNSTLTSASEIVERSNQTLSRPSSPCGSVHSQATVQTRGYERSFSTPSAFQPVATAWTSPTSPQNTLSVCLPPNPLASNPGFGSLASPIPNSAVSQVLYTPYGVYHQMVGPYGNAPVCMMSPQSPQFSNRSPASSYGSQFSPRSFSTSSRFCDSDHDLDFSPKSTKGRSKCKTTLSSSFVESVWQSRFAIIYTTLCYLLLGSLVWACSSTGFATNVFSEVLNWKNDVSFTS